MHFFSPSNIARAMSAHIHCFPKNPIQGTSTDTRNKCQHKLFFPLKGEYFDGHNYFMQAIHAGASGVVCQKDRKLPVDFPETVGVFYVKDTLKAYQDLAKALRQALKPKVIAITGSNGKTTTKYFVSKLLKAQYNVLASPASFNNHIGVPHTLLQIIPETQIVVLEMGMNHPGEIKHLVNIADPDVVLVTTVGRSHLEGLKTLEHIAQAKEEIYKYTKKTALRIFNLDNIWTQKMYKRYQQEYSTLTFSKTNPKANVHLQVKSSDLTSLNVAGIVQGEKGQATVRIFGEHHLNNLMGAASIALAMGLPPSLIWTHFKECRSLWGRTQILTLKDHKVIFDAYNANPDSMEALFTNIANCQISGKWHILLGDMLELGSQAKELHELLGQKVGQAVSSSGMQVGLMAFIGQFGESFAQGLKATGFAKDIMLLDAYQSSLKRDLEALLQPGDVVVIKASRGMKLERLLG